MECYGDSHLFNFPRRNVEGRVVLVAIEKGQPCACGKTRAPRHAEAGAPAAALQFPGRQIPR